MEVGSQLLLMGQQECSYLLLLGNIAASPQDVHHTAPVFVHTQQQQVLLQQHNGRQIVEKRELEVD